MTVQNEINQQLESMQMVQGYSHSKDDVAFQNIEEIINNPHLMSQYPDFQSMINHQLQQMELQQEKAIQERKVYEQEIASLKDKLLKIEETNLRNEQELQKLNTENRNSQMTLQEYKQELSMLDKEYNKVEHEYFQMQEDKEQLKKAIHQKQIETIEIDEQNQHLQSQRQDESNYLDQKLDDLNIKIQSKQSSLENVSKILEQSQETGKEQLGQIEGLSEQVEYEVAQCKNLEQLIDKMQKKIEQEQLEQQN